MVFCGVSVAEKAVRGAAWNMTTGVGARAVTLVGTLLLTRLVAPAEYGEVQAAAICVVTAMMLSNLGLGQYIIAKRADPDEAFHATLAHVGTGALVLLVILASRDRLGPLFEAPRMGRFVPGFALAAILDRVGYVPERTLLRSLYFRSVAITRALGELMFTTVALVSAYWFGGMGIVFAHIARSTQVSSMFVCRANRAEWLHPTPLRGKVFARLIAYCWPFSVSTLSEFGSSRWDNLLVSRYFGPELMGKYNLAYNLADMPMGTVAESLGDVLMPSFSRLEPSQRPAALLRSARFIAILVFPLAVGLGAVAPTVVPTLFDRRWIDIAPMLAILSVIAVARSLAGPLNNFLQAQQRPRLTMALGLVRIGMVLGSIVAVGRHGVLWTCAAVGAAFTVHTFVVLVAAGFVERVPVGKYVLGVVRPLLACGVMGAAIIGQRALLRHAGIGAGWTSLLVEIGVGAIAYALGALLLARQIVDDLIAQLRRVMTRTRVEDSMARDVLTS